MVAEKNFVLFCSAFLYFVANFVFGEVRVLNDDSFEHLTQASTGATTGDWLILFSKAHDNCEKCKEAEELFDKIHDRLKDKMNIAKVVPTRSKLTIKRFGISEWPAVLFLRQGTQYTYQDIKEIIEEKVVQFAEEGYLKTPKKQVPVPVTKFDVFLEDVTGDFEHVMRWRKNAAVVILLFGVLIGLALTPLLTCIANYLVNTFMDEGDADQGGGDGEKRQQEDEKEEDDQKAKRD